MPNNYKLVWLWKNLIYSNLISLKFKNLITYFFENNRIPNKWAEFKFQFSCIKTKLAYWGEQVFSPPFWPPPFYVRIDLFIYFNHNKLSYVEYLLVMIPMNYYFALTRFRFMKGRQSGELKGRFIKCIELNISI